jgi:3-dehydroquinate synthase
MVKSFFSLSELKKILEKQKPSRVVLVTSKELKTKLNWAIKEILKITSGKINLLFLPDGENAKNWKEIEKLLKSFIRHGLDRKCLVLALGGGTVGDAVGFASSIYLRGVNYVNIPTTLLSQVDSAHGGKTGIDFLNYKNQIGTFYNPIAVIVEPRFIKSLKKEQIIDGLGEIIKSGLIKDKTIIKLLDNKTLETIKNGSTISDLIKKSIKAKQFYIAKDFQDKGLRQMLNFGHTIGHALELKHKISHGRAVLYGIIKELEIGEQLGLSKRGLKDNLHSLLEHLGIGLEAQLKPDWKVILRDKKIFGEHIALPMIVNEGVSRVVNIRVSELKEIVSQNLCIS